MPLKASYLLLTGGGALIAYAGIKGKGVGAAAREVIQGQSPGKAAPGAQIQGATYGPGVAATAHAAGTTPAQAAPSTARVAKNQAIGRTLATAYGWGFGSQWNSLVALWNQESGWNNYAYNTNGGATGIPQALPHTKMPRIAWLPSQGGAASATAQITWGLAYIKATYGDPNTAWGGYAGRGGWY